MSQDRVLSRSKNLTNFFAAERKAARLYNTHKLSVKFLFYPYNSPVEFQIAEDTESLNESYLQNLRRVADDLSKTIESQKTELDIIEKRNFTMIKEYNEIIKNAKIVEMDKVIRVSNMPKLKKEVNKVASYSIQDGESLIIDNKPILITEKFRIILLALNLIKTNQLAEAMVLCDVLMNNLSHNYYAFIMRKIKMTHNCDDSPR
jgi:hypothetical protein